MLNDLDSELISLFQAVALGGMSHLKPLVEMNTYKVKRQPSKL